MGRLTYICLHWTAGGYNPNKIDLQHYHYLIGGDAKMYLGRYKPEDNIDCTRGGYAAHAGGGNTGRIGISYCGMNGFINPKKQGRFPLKKEQLEKGFALCANLMGEYKIPLENIETHYTFGKAHPKTTSFGKIDIIFLPPYPDIKPQEVLPFIKNKVNWYFKKYVL